MRRMMSTTPVMLSSVPNVIETRSLPTFSIAPNFAFSQISDLPKSTIHMVNAVQVNIAITIDAPSANRRAAVALLKGRRSWTDRESREFYAEAAVEQGLAYQIRVNRERRKMSQRELGKIVGTRQSAISRMEDPDYGSHSIPKLLKVAHAFDCALLVKLVPFSMLAVEAEHLSEHDLYANSYDEEIQENNPWLAEVR